MTGKLPRAILTWCLHRTTCSPTPRSGRRSPRFAERNRHHLEQMTESERNDALAHWHDLAVVVLTAASAALGGEEGDQREHGRAVIVLEDAGNDEVAVHASFFPQLEDLGGEVLVTPAQAAALELLEAMTGPDEDDA